MTLIRLLMTNFKRTIRANCAISVGSLFPLSIKALAPDCQGWERSWPLDRSLPPPQLLAWNKQTFLSTKLAPLLAFEWWASGPHFHLYFEKAVSLATQRVEIALSYLVLGLGHQERTLMARRPVREGSGWGGVALNQLLRKETDCP